MFATGRAPNSRGIGLEVGGWIPLLTDACPAAH